MSGGVDVNTSTYNICRANIRYGLASQYDTNPSPFIPVITWISTRPVIKSLDNCMTTHSQAHP